MRLDNIGGSSGVKCTILEDVPFTHGCKGFAVASIMDRYILLTGGANGVDSIFDSYFGDFNCLNRAVVFDTVNLKTVKLNDLCHYRQLHSSCATESVAFVYGGRGQQSEELGTAEVLLLGQN